MFVRVCACACAHMTAGLAAMTVKEARADLDFFVVLHLGLRVCVCHFTVCVLLRAHWTAGRPFDPHDSNWRKMSAEILPCVFV